MNKTAASGFSRDTDRYHRSRPPYHSAMVRRVADRFCSGNVVELGAGSGIFTRQIVDQGISVIAIEPVLGMRNALAQFVPEADIRVGAAETIPLDESTVDNVLAAQSFHWFNYREALDEIYRVLRVGGHLVTVWNIQDETVPWVAEISNVLQAYARDTPRHRNMAWRRTINSDARFGSVDEWRTSNKFPTNMEGVVDRALSTSYVASLPNDKQADVAEAVSQIVAPLGPRFDYPYVSQLQAWRTLGPHGDNGIV